ncbi:hypothetical protein ACFPL7_23960 [Dongia soli]|uniref:Uncharacterized protein n=1 Tax=Dongia soli TaxID=600628 RepID=A0ABU5EG18_9PROT|nr:hypothetical protein [Dongia soli]MDY0885359.1 hypothetical protein [Dongia soli]
MLNLTSQPLSGADAACPECGLSHIRLAASISGSRQEGRKAVSNVTKLSAGKAYDAEEWQLRVDLAAAFRIAVEMNWHESVSNHFSVAVSPDGKNF